MSQIGIIAEFNPLHTGHKYLIDYAKTLGSVTCVMSGNFVQRGDIAIFPKSNRAEFALKMGCDLVAELPVNWAMSTAQNFALGSIYILNNLGCDTLLFGSECGDINKLSSICEILESEQYKGFLTDELKKGITFAKARENAVKLCGGEYKILSAANNNLAIEYMLSAKKINPKIRFITIKRQGASHDSNKLDTFVSASLIRGKILNNKLAQVKDYIPSSLYNAYVSLPFADIKNIENAILSVLRLKLKSDFSNLPDISEGLENKLVSSIKSSTSLEQLYENLKVKRYTLARIRRLVLSAVLGIDNEFFMKAPPYIRILGFNKTGEDILKNNAKKSSIPIISKSSDILKLGNSAIKVFENECKATDLYNLSLNIPKECGCEYTEKLIKAKD